MVRPWLAAVLALAALMALPLLGDDAAGAPITGMTAAPDGLKGVAAAELGGRVYLFGGHDGSVPTDRIMAFDPHTETYTARAAVLPEPKHFMGAASDGSRYIYLVGGIVRNDTNLHNGSMEIWRYDTVIDRVDDMAGRLPYGIAVPRAVYLGGVVYVFGDGVCISSCPVWAYSVAADRVTRMSASQPGSRHFPAVATDGSVVYYSGGMDADTGSPYNDMYVFDPVRDEMDRLTARLPLSLYGHAAAWDGSAVVITGGIDARGIQSDQVWRHDPAAGVTPHTDDLPWATAHHAFVWAQTGFVLHGAGDHRQAACFDCVPEAGFDCTGGKPPYQRIWITESSRHPWRGLAAWSFDWDDGVSYTLTDRSWIPTVYDYAEPGYKLVRLTVTDTAGTSASQVRLCEAWRDEVPNWDPDHDGGLLGVFACGRLQTTLRAVDEHEDPMTYRVDEATMPPGATFSGGVFRWQPAGAIGDFGPVLVYASDGNHEIVTQLHIRSVACPDPDAPASEDADRDGQADIIDACPTEEPADASTAGCGEPSAGPAGERETEIEQGPVPANEPRPNACLMPPTPPEAPSWKGADLSFHYDPPCPMVEFIAYSADGGELLASLRYGGPGNYTFDRLGLTDESTVQIMARPYGAERIWDRTWSVAVQTPYGCRDCRFDVRGAPGLPEPTPDAQPAVLDEAVDPGVPTAANAAFIAGGVLVVGGVAFVLVQRRASRRHARPRPNDVR